MAEGYELLGTIVGVLRGGDGDLPGATCSIGRIGLLPFNPMSTLWDSDRRQRERQRRRQNYSPQTAEAYNRAGLPPARAAGPL